MSGTEAALTDRVDRPGVEWAGELGQRQRSYWEPGRPGYQKWPRCRGPSWKREGNAYCKEGHRRWLLRFALPPLSVVSEAFCSS